MHYCQRCRKTFAGECWSCAGEGSKQAAKAAARRRKRREDRLKDKEEHELLDAAIEQARTEDMVRAAARAIVEGKPTTAFDAAFVEAFSAFLEARGNDAFLWCSGYLFVKSAGVVTGYPMSEADMLRLRAAM